MTNFSVGDRVRVTKPRKGQEDYKGMVFKIVNVHGTDAPYCVSIGEGRNTDFYEDELSPLKKKVEKKEQIHLGPYETKTIRLKYRIGKPQKKREIEKLNLVELAQSHLI